MKKKIFVAIMAMTMSLSMVACTGTVPTTSASTEETTTAVVEEKEETVAEVESSDEASSMDSLENLALEVKEEGEALQADLEENAIASLGKIDGDAYTNEYFGIKMTLPEGYTFADEAMMKEVYGYATDILKEADNKAVAKQLESGAAQCVAIGYDSTGLNNLNVTVQQNVLLTNTMFDEKAIIIMSLNTVTETLEAQGVTDIQTEIVEEEIAGETHTVLKMSGKLKDYDYHGLMINLQKGNYMMGIGATSFGDDNTAEMFEHITALD